MLRLPLIAVIGIFMSFGMPSVSNARDAQTVINTMLAEVGARRPADCPGRWCACYMDEVLERVGLEPRGSNLARDFANYGEASQPAAIGSIMVMRSHVGVVIGRCENGTVMIVSGNYSNKVGVGCYSENKAIAWRAPAAA